MYLALLCVLAKRVNGSPWAIVPLWRRPLLFDLGKDAFDLVVGAMSARRQLTIALDLLPSALITGLERGKRFVSTSNNLGHDSSLVAHISGFGERRGALP